MKRYKMIDVVSEISERENCPSTSGYDHFVGLEHYVSGEVKITKFGSTANLDSAMKVFHSGDILVARRNVYLKRASVVFFDGLTSGDSIVLRAKDNRIARLLPFVLNTDAFWNYADQHSDGTMSKRLSPKTLMQYEFDLPDEDRQDYLADTLWAAAETKESYQRLLTQTDELIKSQFIEMFGLPDTNEHGFDLGTIADVVNNVHYGTSRKSTENGKYVYIRMNNITYDGELDLTDTKRIDVPDKELEGCLVCSGDVLFNRTNSRDLVGKTCSFNLSEPMVIAGYIIRLRMNGRVYADYLSTFLNLAYSKRILLGMAKGAVGQANINAQEVQSIAIVIPPKEKQDKFLLLKQQSDKSKYELKQAIENISALIKSLIQQDFSN